ncbi:hypothetical protein AGMMS50249_6570 [candidate division SR1 bacterium]|nr:hypothetical protein AGMMS50249_6570 [candidate division SR1 bacterium]
MKKILKISILSLFLSVYGLAFTSFAQDTAPTQPANDSTLGITMNTDCLQSIGCSFDIQKAIGIDKSKGTNRASTLMFIQDVVTAAAMFIGTIVTIAFLRAGVLFIIAGRKGDKGLHDKAVKGMINSIIGLVLVACSLGIIRFIQYIAMT